VATSTSFSRWGYFSIALASFGGGIAQPYLVLYLHLVRHFSLPVSGAILGVASFTSLLIGFLGGTLLDGRKAGRFVSYSLLLGGVSLALLNLAPIPALAVLAVVGISGAEGFYWIALNTTAGAVSSSGGTRDPEALFARVFIAVNVGVGMGSMLGGQIGERFGLSANFLVACSFTLLAALVAYRNMPVAQLDKSVPEEGVIGYLQVLRDSRFRIFLLIEAVLLLFGYAQIEGGFNIYAVLVAKVPLSVVGYALFANTVVIVLAQLKVGQLVGGLKRSTALSFAGILWALSWMIAGSALELRGSFGATVAVIASMALFGLGETLYSPVAPAITNGLAEPVARGRYNAMSSSLWAVTGILASPLATSLIATHISFLWPLTALLGATLSALAVRLILPRILPDSLDSR
jgi:MFS family permease